MYNCPNCSGNLTFDIASQKLMCDYCKTQMDPYEYQKTQDAEERDDFGVTVFTCPQCGGEIMTTNVTAAGFCTYCGASTILDSRMRTEKRPQHIIPFTKTKEDCRNAYSKLVKQSLFAPSAFKDPEYLERFRGIYMPYWVYNFDLQGSLRLEGTKSYRRGDYKITDHFNLSGEVNASYKGITYDASSSFDDTVASAIAPFKSANFKPFTPSILRGFYADAPDVKSSVYNEPLSEMLYDDAMERFSGVPEFRKNGMTLPSGKKLQNVGINVEAEKPVCAYLPVWFLTYRKNDRVAYAVMNGDTGKITADIPVDEKKYLLGSLVLALPFFAVLSFLFTMTGHMVLTCSSVLALLSLTLYWFAVSAISDKDMRAGDRGYLFTVHHSQRPEGSGKKPGKSGGKGDSLTKVLRTIIIVAVIAAIGVRPVLQFLTGDSRMNAYSVYAIVSVLLLAAVYAMIWAMAESESAKKNIRLHTLGSVLAVILAGVILVWNPVSDLWFYGGSILAAAGVCVTYIGIINKYNIQATRPLPTFYDRKGGNDRA